METLTVQQRAAVENQGGSLLVAAAAGSGKTKVLVERLFRRVTEDHANIDDFLIITYTRAAAAELRGKIAAELSRRIALAPENEHLRRQLPRVYQADISTVDAFCCALVRENTHLLTDETSKYALTPDFRVLDDAEAALIRERVLLRTLETFYSDMTPGRELLADTMGAGNDDRRLISLTLETYEKLQSHADPLAWLAKNRQAWETPAEHFDDTPYVRELLQSLKRTTSHWAEILRRYARRTEDDPAIFRGYGEKFLKAAFSMDALNPCTEWDSAVQAVSQIDFPRLTTPKGRKDEPFIQSLKRVWELCKEEIKKLQKPVQTGAADAMEDLRAIAPAMTALLDLTALFSEDYRKEKLRLNAADFSDQEHLALKLLLNGDGSPSALGKQIAARYTEVLVDEYQDTNEVQNAIFRAVSREEKNLFTVGDVKQSIYRFRLADPGIFLEKYNRFVPYGEAQEGQERKILLSRNFRSRREILDAANYVFANILSPQMGEMSYGAEEALYFGAAYYPERNDCTTEFHLIAAQRSGTSKNTPDGSSPATPEDSTLTPDDSTLNARDGSTVAPDGAESTDAAPVKRIIAEARFVAGKIRELLDNGFPVTERDGTLRPCVPDDIVILMRSPGTRLTTYYEALSERDIPCSFDENGEFFASMEISTMLSLLYVTDNPRQDVPLISVLRSPVFGFSPDVLAEIRAHSPDTDFYEAVQRAAAMDDDNADDVNNGNTDDADKDTADGNADESGEKFSVPADREISITDAEKSDVADVGKSAVAHKADYPPVTEDTQRKCQFFLETLSGFRSNARDMSVRQLIWQMYNSLNILGVFGAMDSGAERRDNLIFLSRYAEQFEKNGYRGLFAFVTQLRRLIDAERAPAGGHVSGNGVTLMSVHRSKGLEFPVVILADLDHEFSRQDFNAPVLVHPEMGLGPQYVDLQRRIRYPTLARAAVESRLKRENLSEEQRILYVAMTRPKEKLILVDSLYNAEKRIQKLSAMTGRPVEPETVAQVNSFGDWLLLTLLSRPEAQPLYDFAGVEREPLDDDTDMECVPLNDGTNVEREPSGDGTNANFAPPENTDTDGALWGNIPWKVFVHDAEEFQDISASVPIQNDSPAQMKNDGNSPVKGSSVPETPFDPALLEWVYPYQKATRLPAKVTATQLKGRALDDEIAENAAHTPYIRPLAQPKFRWKEHQLTAAERGTATHLILQYLNFSGADPAQQAAEFVKQRLLTPEQAAAVNMYALRRFMKSPLAAQIRQTAPEQVHREYRFTLLMDAAEYGNVPFDSGNVPFDGENAGSLSGNGENAGSLSGNGENADGLYGGNTDDLSGENADGLSGDKILLQGVVDCWFETPDGITVVDFKTDYIRDAQDMADHAARYRTQLYAYSRALERILEKPVIRRVLYFLSPGESMDV